MTWAKPEDAAKWQRRLGYRVRELRQERGLSQMELAHLSDLHPTYVSSIETGRRNVSLSTLYVLAGSLEVPVRDLFDGEKVRSPRKRR